MKVLIFTLLSLLIVSCNGNSPNPDSNSGTRGDSDRILRKKRDTFNGDEVRLALVIGNGAYENTAKLKNPTNDSRDMRDKLQSLGFRVIYLENGDRGDMKSKIRQFQKEFQKNENVVTLFYYAGHGMEHKGVNYLIPVDADIETEDELDDEALSFNFLLDKFDISENRLIIAILDACRDSEFTRSSKGGLASAQAKGTFIAYATALGDVADDNRDERNGLFTKHILRNIDREDIKLEDTFKNIATDVKNESRGSQTPWISFSVTDGDFYFRGDGVIENHKPEVVVKEKIVEKEVIKTVVDNSEIERLKKELAESKAEKKRLAEELDSSTTVGISSRVEKTQNTYIDQKTKLMWQNQPFTKEDKNIMMLVQMVVEF
jgi:hypothetical protein